MGDLLKRATELIRNEGFLGAHSLLFLLRYAYLSEDRALLRQVGSTLEELDSLPESAMLAYVYAEYAEADDRSFCAPAARFLLDRCDEDDRMLLPALAKCARVFEEERFLSRAVDLAAEEARDPFTALGLLELYRATRQGNYLNLAAAAAEEIRLHFSSIFDVKDTYDLEAPSGNSAVALLYDELFRITQESKWEEARRVQNSLVSRLADKYPTRVAFGLCALLADHFPWETIVCALPESVEPPQEVRALLRFYAPLTEVLLIPAETKQPKYFRMKQGKLEPIPGI